MIKNLRSFLGVIATVVGLQGAQVTQASAYQIDCAILLCLAGGFPSSAPCAAAKATMIERITPWPIEPPLQIWRCPMRASFLSFKRNAGAEQIHIRFAPLHTTQLDQENLGLRLLSVLDTQIENYLAAIKVYHLRYWRSYSKTSDTCSVFTKLEIGTYNEDGVFTWRRQNSGGSPTWLFDTSYSDCSPARFRGVGMEWRDHQNVKGTEVVTY